jgi:hypothetical protein
MWPYGSGEPPLGPAPTYADRLEAHWDALPLRRKLRVLLYLSRRLVRYAPREIATSAAAYTEQCRATLTYWGQWLAYAFALMRWALTPDGRYAIADFMESFVTFRTARDAAPLVAAAIFLIMLTGLDRNATGRNTREHMSVVEAARLVRHYRPPPCYLVDGEVWIDAEGGPFYPGRRGYRELRQRTCGS